ncbi:MAG: hypothetical protein AB4041_13655 [Microcystaceae cyanobacterium]
MTLISIEELVKQALDSGYLSLEAEETLRQILWSGKPSTASLEAFWQLQQATMNGQVRQQSREKLSLLA